MREISFNLEWKYQYDHVFAPFIQQYGEENRGRMPFFNPTVAARVDFYKNQSADAFADARERRENFVTFIEDEVLTASNESCSNAL